MRIKLYPTSKVVHDDEIGVTLVGAPAKLVTRPKIPSDAFIISVNPPLWIQFGKGKYIITKGFMWLREKMEETFTEDFAWHKTFDGWEVRISKELPVAGIWYLKKEKISGFEKIIHGKFLEMFSAMDEGPMRNNVIFLDFYSIIKLEPLENTAILIENGSNYIHIHELEMKRVKLPNGKTAYVPRYYFSGDDV